MHAVEVEIAASVDTEGVRDEIAKNALADTAAVRFRAERCTGCSRDPQEIFHSVLKVTAHGISREYAAFPPRF